MKYFYNVISTVLFFVFCLSMPAQSLEKKIRDVNAYFFGHSLVYHTEYKVPTPKDHASIPHWLAELARAAGHRFSADGQFGFVRNHAQFPPKANWGFQNVDSGWGGTFGRSDYSAAILTAANFVQYQDVDDGYYDDKNVSPLSASLEILDYVNKESPNTPFLIYENWPDMGEFAKDFPPKAPSEKKLTQYHRYTNGQFHKWWLDYQDKLNKARPQAKVKMIPVGPVLSKLMTDTPVKNIPFVDLFEDNAPHGRPTTYFLAALIHYMALFQEKPPVDYTFDKSIHPVVQKHYPVIVDLIWRELLAFKDNKGVSRVW
ncbi:MAG: hypothetical protein K6L80_11050 [Agarilytica sp.]